MTDREKVLIVVEGKSDKKFIKDVIAHLNLLECRIDSAGSKDNLGDSLVDIKRYAKELHTALIIFDADDDIKESRRDIKRVLGDVLPNDNVFLMPDNKNTGELETLLREIVHPGYKFILKCFDKYFNNYRECLEKEKGEPPIQIPSPKDRRKSSRHVYCQAVKAKADAEKTNYQNRDHWDLDDPALEPLKNFLITHISPAST